MNPYVVRSDLYVYGVPRGTLVAPGLRTDRALAATNAATLAGHGFETGDAFILRSDPGSTLPTGLTDGQTYYAIRIDDSTLQFASSPTGSAIPFSADLAGSMTLNTSLDGAIESLCEDRSREFDDTCHQGRPLTAPFPPRAVSITARLVAYDVLCLLGRRNDSTMALRDDAEKDRANYARGIRMTDPKAPAGSAFASSTGHYPERGHVP